mgnify:CR=1 FL=1
MPPYQIIKCDVEDEQSLGTYETLAHAKVAWAELIARRYEISSIAMELIDNDLEVLETFYFV